METQDPDEIIPEDQTPPNTDADGDSRESGSSNLEDLKNAKGKLDDFTRLAKGGPKPPIQGAAGEAGAGVGGAGATAGGAEAAGITAGGATAATGTGAAAGGTTAAAAGAGTGAAAATGGAAAGTAGAGAAAASAPLWPWILIVGVVLLIIILIILFIIGLLSDGELSSTDSPINLSKSGPSSVANGEIIAYSFEVTYEGIADDVIITDRIPDNTEFVSAPMANTLDASGAATTNPVAIKIVEWSLREIQGGPPQSAFNAQTLTLSVRPLENDVYVLNQAMAEVIGGTGNPNITPGPSGIIPPNENDCDGYYTNFINRNPLKKNFGDPSCTMLANSKPEDKDKLYALFQQLDSAYADYWFFTIVPCESSYIPNNYANYWPELHDQYPNLDPDGVWGLLQMGSDLDNDGSGKNGPLDRGDVNWEKQVSNGIDYSRWIVTQGGSQWAYWQCANDTHP